MQGLFEWARLVLNQRPLACEERGRATPWTRYWLCRADAAPGEPPFIARGSRLTPFITGQICPLSTSIETESKGSAGDHGPAAVPGRDRGADNWQRFKRLADCERCLTLFEVGLRGSDRLAGTSAAILAVVVMVGAPAAASAAPTWTKPVTLGPTGRESGPPQIAVTPDGEVLVVWEGGRPNGIQVTSRPPGQGWRRPVALGTSSGGNPHIAATGKKAVVVWSGGARGAEVVFAATRLPGGRW